MKNIITVTAVLCGAIALVSMSSCNTVDGFGKDLQKLGKKMERKSD